MVRTKQADRRESQTLEARSAQEMDLDLDQLHAEVQMHRGRWTLAVVAYSQTVNLSWK